MVGRWIARWIGVLCLLSGIGCAAPVPYHYGHSQPVERGDAPVELAGPEIKYGKENKRLDRMARIVALPSRILGLNKKINNHDVSPETVEALRTYLVENDLADVTVLVNDYSPADQWRRIKANRRIGGGWRYTAGTLSWMSYTLFPSRVFGGDDYDPYANALEINSDLPAIALYEAAFAKDVHSRRWPGNYVAWSGLPGIGIFRSSHELREVLGYAQEKNNWELERQAYHVLYSQVGAETASLGGWLMPVWWAMPVLGMGGAAAGHATGRMVAARREAQIDARAPDAEPAEPEAPEVADKVQLVHALGPPDPKLFETQPAGKSQPAGETLSAGESPADAVRAPGE